MNSLLRKRTLNSFSNPNVSIQISRKHASIFLSIDSSRKPHSLDIKPPKTTQISKPSFDDCLYPTQSIEFHENLQIPCIKPRQTTQISKPRFRNRSYSTQSIGIYGSRQNESIKPHQKTQNSKSRFQNLLCWTQSRKLHEKPQIPSTNFSKTTQISRPMLQNRVFSTQSSKFPEYEMPSVTWGVIQGRKEKLVSRVIICDYLKSLGIIPDELEHLELPSTVEVMKERVEFLQKLGLTIDDMNEYPLMLGCSVRKNTIPVLGYLEKIGIQRSKLGEFIKNYPQVLHASVVVELVPVVKFLRGLDVEKQDIPYVLQKYPELFGFKLEGTMSTSVAYLVSIGVSPRDIGPMVTQYPYFLGMRVGTTIKPIVDYLVSLGIPKKVLARMLEKRAYILGYDLEETMKLNVDCLLSFGIRRESIASVVTQYPQILGLPLKAKLSSQQYFFNLKLKIDPEGFARAIEKMPQIVSLNQNVILKPVEFLRGRGISVDDVAKMIVKCPQLVTLRVELMKNSFYFFKSEMKRAMQELVEFPEYLTYSLESRIKPRYQRLASKGIRCSLAWFLNCSDQRFEERLQADFIEMESVGPSFCMGGKLEMPGSELVSDEEDESDNEVLYRRTVSL
ncbi:transcription termination factor MTERF4, chloroplastic [Magnolia sinica]|uniref:transcription termination factor MTERF4, chloroplastic n=1 Tax=Magnolia sinica TaxID=86752 RepID=UPI00265AF8F0|nr:transcription termination factor MTERF4, chloroplastic [Magnolia sinica]